MSQELIVGLAPRIRKKIKTCKLSDWYAYRKYKEVDYVDIVWVKEQLLKNKYRCCLCSCQLKVVDWKPEDYSQFSVDRINNSVAHIKSNCQITCLSCNKKKH